MNLENLVSIGSINNGWSKKEVVWQNGEDEVRFDILAKQEMTAADHEFIFLGGGRRLSADSKSGADEEDSFAARQVHRMVRMEDNETIPFETAKRFKNSLLLAICKALNEVEVQPDVEDSKKKPRASRKNSGTS